MLSYRTTSEFDAKTKAAYWNSVLRESMYELDFEASKASFEAELRQHKVGPLKLNRVIISTGHEVTRSRNAIAHSQVSSFHLNYVQRGEFTVTQCGQEASIGPGECVLIDGRQPYRVVSHQRTVHVCLHLPVEWLQYWVPHPEEYLARPIKKGMPWSNALVASLNDAHLIADTPDGLHGLCADQLAGAIALALGPRTSTNSTHCRKVYFRFLETLAEMSNNPELDAQTVADALSISPRYLYKILSRENTTYCRELIRIRLERAARMLKDKRFDCISIAEVAWRNGFRDPSHFSKRFHQAYRVTPGGFRNTYRRRSN